MKMSDRDIAENIKKSKTSVERYLAVAGLPKNIWNWIKSGELSLTNGYKIADIFKEVSHSGTLKERIYYAKSAKEVKELLKTGSKQPVSGAVPETKNKQPDVSHEPPLPEQIQQTKKELAEQKDAYQKAMEEAKQNIPFDQIAEAMKMTGKIGDLSGLAGPDAMSKIADAMANNPMFAAAQSQMSQALDREILQKEKDLLMLYSAAERQKGNNEESEKLRKLADSRKPGSKRFVVE